MKRLFKDKRGMTLMEMLVALTLLMMIIVGTAPIMLQAYDGLYKAGEYTQDTYEAKSEIEEKLATRNTRTVYPNFVVNFDNLGDVVEINGRRAVSSLYGSLETIFTNGKVHVAIVSAKNINDDYSNVGYVPGASGATVTAEGWHEIVLQTTNLDFGTTSASNARSHISLNTPTVIVDGGKKVDVQGNESENGTLKLIDISFVKPDKTTNSAKSVYTYKTGNLANVDYNNIKVDPLTGRITVRVNGFDFTQSPIQVYVSYLDENKLRQTTETYLFVETPTIMAAGATGSYQYYTSPGVVTKKVKNQSGNFVETTEFGVYARTMRIDETYETGQKVESYTNPVHGGDVRYKIGATDIKSGTIIKNITWVEDDITTPHVKPYYVMTGTNGAIYRTYSLTGEDDDLEDMIIPKDKTYTLEDRTGTIVYPALWGGDKAHQFGYATYGKSMSYKNSSSGGADARNSCWYTESGADTGVGHDTANAYSTSAEYSYYYNGWGQTYTYMNQKSRKISYILTEHGNPLRLGGYMAGESSQHANYNIMWENLNNINNPTDYTVNSKYPVDHYEKVTTIVGSYNKKTWSGRYFYHPTYGSDITTVIWGEGKSGHEVDNDCPLYLDDDLGLIGTGHNGDMFSDVFWANIRIKYLSNMPLEYFHASGRRGNSRDSEATSVRFLQHEQETISDKVYDVYDPKITVTDAVYLPALKSMFYVGSVAADAYIQQNDNISNDAGWVEKYKFEPANSNGAITTYFVRGNNDNTATEVHKYSYDSVHYDGYDFEWDHYNALVTDYYLADKATMTTMNTSDMGNVAEKFFVTRPSSPASALFNDVLFTFGFSSNREFVYSEIAYGKVGGTLKESYKGCEPYYFKSHYKGDSLHIPHLALLDDNDTLYSDTAGNLNKKDNDYYNVWFPGEMYNLTKVASKDGITVAVGYAVSGSSYQYVLGSQHMNTSTALGGIFNDGVLACTISIADGSEATLSNLLYFKDNTSFDSSYLSGKAGYSTAFTSGYGTHSRDSVQFTTVDIGVQNVSANKTEYYAYYADNKGRVFRSKVATIEIADSKETITQVDYISDAKYEPGAVVPDELNAGYMEQLKPANTTFTALFEKITTIKIDGDMIFISGKPNQSASFAGIPLVVGKIDEVTNAITWTIVYEQTGSASITYKNCWVEDMLVLDGYVYLAGRTKDNKGFVSALKVESIKEKIETNLATCNLTAEYVEVPDALYAIAGHINS